jgi:hypothetical protein
VIAAMTKNESVARCPYCRQLLAWSRRPTNVICPRCDKCFRLAPANLWVCGLVAVMELNYCFWWLAA